MSMIRFLGHSVFHVSAPGLEGLIDPFLKGKTRPAWLPGILKA